MKRIKFQLRPKYLAFGIVIWNLLFLPEFFQMVGILPRIVPGGILVLIAGLLLIFSQIRLLRSEDTRRIILIDGYDESIVNTSCYFLMSMGIMICLSSFLF